MQNNRKTQPLFRVAVFFAHKGLADIQHDSVDVGGLAAGKPLVARLGTVDDNLVFINGDGELGNRFCLQPVQHFGEAPLGLLVQDEERLLKMQVRISYRPVFPVKDIDGNERSMGIVFIGQPGFTDYEFKFVHIEHLLFGIHKLYHRV